MSASACAHMYEQHLLLRSNGECSRDCDIGSTPGFLRRTAGHRVRAAREERRRGVAECARTLAVRYFSAIRHNKGRTPYGLTPQSGSPGPPPCSTGHTTSPFSMHARSHSTVLYHYCTVWICVWGSCPGVRVSEEGLPMDSHSPGTFGPSVPTVPGCSNMPSH